MTNKKRKVIEENVNEENVTEENAEHTEENADDKMKTMWMPKNLLKWRTREKSLRDWKV